jgi:ABC-type multidrug transport system fused ATPase/permease subunit
LIFAKSLRKKDVKGATANKNVRDINGHADGEESAKLIDPKDDDSEAEEVDEVHKSRQGVVNLVGVDAKRVADFATLNNLFVSSIVRLTIAIAFLWQLVGWQALLVGVSVQLLFLPANIHFSRKYADGQDLLMKTRDTKLSVVNEALSGIRQIKFAALERQWQKKILEARENELKALWATLLADVILIGLWIIGPIMLSAASIVTYALIHGSLEPSVAFTTISVLGKIEMTLSYLPELTTDGLDAWVSIKRIAEYLNAPDKEIVTVPGEKISFEDATIAWPTDEISDETFQLRKMNLDFPRGELSVISGKTGSGKSLILSALLGEVEVLDGKITLPKSPSVAERNDKAANKGNWILPSAVAYVPQIPWIENCSLKDNVLFGLPYDESRYKEVIQACALQKDLEILVDGDRTEIGPRGINLSGGQCWRLTLARALYSRAGILVLDDIFSAVDAHVGKHIFENALTGSICEGRTRILVTHHVALCLPKTNYEVHLGDGVVDYAGTVEDLERSGILGTVLEDSEAIDDTDDGIEDALEAISRKISHSSRTLSQVSRHTSPLLRKPSRRRLSVTSLRSVEAFRDGPEADVPEIKKFVEDEQIETGHVDFRIYKIYLKACGGAGFWCLAIFMFAAYEILLLGRVSHHHHQL